MESELPYSAEMSPLQAKTPPTLSTEVRVTSTGVDSKPVPFRFGLTPVVWIAAIAFAIKVAMAFFTYGTVDVSTFRLDAITDYVTLYRDGVYYVVRGKPFPVQVFSHPPSMLHVLHFWHFLEGLTGLPLQFWMRLSCAVADVVSLSLVWMIGRRVPVLRITPLSLMLIAACPISIVVSGFHGNTDPIMVSLLLASIYFVDQKPSVAGLFFGLAMCIKIVPVIFGLAFLLYLPSLRSRLGFVASAAAVFIAAGMPYFFFEPVAIFRGFVSYSGQQWVTSMLLDAFGVPPIAHKLLFFGLVLALTLAMRRAPLFTQVGTVTLLFLAFAPGFAIQYLAWGVPFVACLGVRSMLAYHLLPGAFLIRLYTMWCDGFPWYRADDSTPPRGHLEIALGISCWVSIWIVFFAFTSRRKSEAE
jgi:uncharacterized membrane protein